MLDELHVTNVALIREATLMPARGLTVITGETGAGKTALLSALKLIVGDRAEASMVREGEDALSVEARFFPLRREGREMVASRSVGADGRSRVHIDGRIAGVRQLAEDIGSTVDLCGQHEHQRLMRQANHRAILDAWAGPALDELAAAYTKAWEEAQEAARAVDEVRAAGELGAEAVEGARFILRRIEEVNPKPGEYEDLSERVPKIENADALMRAVEGAHEALAGDGGALDTLGRAAQLLESMTSVDGGLGPYAESLREASYVVEDVSRDVRSYADAIDYDVADLESLQERMGELQGLMRSWGPTMEEVLSARDEAQRTVDAVEGYDEQLARAIKLQAEAEKRLEAAADALHHARAAAAPAFAEGVCAQMARLELGGSAFECAVDWLPREKWTAAGADRVEFMFRAGQGMSARPLAKIASGGEMSRVTLAIKVVLGERDDVDTLVFDEVDAGVGGQTARALADVLAGLAETHQVIVVTHLPQVAVRGDAHYVVRKSGTEEPETSLSRVEGEARAAEIARMLAGDESDAALAHARELLDEARESSR